MILQFSAESKFTAPAMNERGDELPGCRLQRQLCLSTASAFSRSANEAVKWRNGSQLCNEYFCNNTGLTAMPFDDATARLRARHTLELKKLYLAMSLHCFRLLEKIICSAHADAIGLI
jgi:hypothetical protein